MECPVSECRLPLAFGPPWQWRHPIQRQSLMRDVPEPGTKGGWGMICIAAGQIGVVSIGPERFCLKPQTQGRISWRTWFATGPIAAQLRRKFVSPGDTLFITFIFIAFIASEDP